MAHISNPGARAGGKPDKAWSFRRGAAVILLAFALYAALSVGHMQLVARTIGMEAYLGDGERLPASLLIVSQASKAAALMAAIWLLIVRPAPDGWRAVGFRAASLVWFLIAGGLGLLFVATGFGLVRILIDFVPSWSGFTAAPFTFADSGGAGVAASYLLMTVALTPIAEEVFFRSFLYRWMTGHHPVWAAALFSSIMFGASHIIPPQAINAALLSLALIWLYRASGSIWPAILAHAVNNAVGVTLASLAAEGRLPAWATAPG